MTGNGQPCLHLEGEADGDSRGDNHRARGLSVVPSEPQRDLREVFLELRAPICRYLMSLGLQRAAAEDIAQESFLRLCEQESRENGARAENVRGWMFRVAHNLALDEYRRQKRRPTEDLKNGESLRLGHEELLDSAQSPEESLLERERDARLKAALLRLPDEWKQCLHLRAEGLRYREMAEVLGVAISTVAERVQKGLKQLERELA